MHFLTCPHWCPRTSTFLPVTTGELSGHLDAISSRMLLPPFPLSRHQFLFPPEWIFPSSWHITLSFLPLVTLPTVITYLFHLQINPRKSLSIPAVIQSCHSWICFHHVPPPANQHSSWFHFRVSNSTAQFSAFLFSYQHLFSHGFLDIAHWLDFLLPQCSHLFSLLFCDSSSFLQSLNFGESENSSPGHLLLWICPYRFGNITQSHKFKYYVHVDNYKTDMSHAGLFSQLRVHLTNSPLNISDWTSISHFKFWVPNWVPNLLLP